MYRDIYITDLISVDILQQIQDAFSELTGMAALTTDREGKPVTVGSNFTDFCMKYIRSSPEGGAYCEWCDKYGAEQSMEQGHQATYVCHAGLIDFSAPINVRGHQIGCFIGGQVLLSMPDEDKIRKVAETVGVDPELLLQAAWKVNIVPKNVIDRAAQFLYELANILSEIAYSKYVTEVAEQDMEKASQMKSDFLANMSHEIRTPMNAVIGMAEMALREDLPPTARFYINQIKASGRELLTIINDILDFSKIESGKLDIIPVEYDSLAIINDVINILMTRLKDKNLELILNLSPDIPKRLLGDDIRIKQVLINLANNAAKFTNEGKITVDMSYRKISKDEIELRISVEDTGIGIKEEDIDKLFQSFQQVDSKRNRNVEGTGLGLAISQQLINLMGGQIWVESVYEQGSKFSFAIPQKIVDDAPSIEMPEVGAKAVVGNLANAYVREQLVADCEKLGLSYTDVGTVEKIDQYVQENSEKEIFCFIENEQVTEEWRDFARKHEEIKFLLMVDYFNERKTDFPNVLIMKKPVYVLNLDMLLEGGDMNHVYMENGEDECDFIAPEAEVLIVDDNSVNLTIAEGLLKPLKMKIQTADSGKEAINKAKMNSFDLILMDHMMPEMDGIEATHLLREMERYKDIPIIALSANAIGDIRQKFISEGMSDFVPKPIELHVLISKVRQWLPDEKIQPIEEGGEAEEEQDSLPNVIGDLDIPKAVSMLGSKDLYRTVLENYYKVIEKKAIQIREAWEAEDWKRYTIEVHALKSSSRQIGATELANMAEKLEDAGNAQFIDYIGENTEPLLVKYLAYLSLLEPYFHEEENNTEKEAISEDKLRECFDRLRAAAEDLDMDQMEEVTKEMNGYFYPEEQQELFTRLKDAILAWDTEECESILQEWMDCL